MNNAIVNISEKIDKPALDALINVFNSASGRVTIYLNSSGGETGYMEAMVGLINDRHKTNPVELIAFKQILSAAFELFFMVKCDRKLLPGTVGMMHQCAADITINEFAKPVYFEGIALSKFMKTFARERTLRIFKDLKLTQAEINNINKGQDVYFQYSRMIELLKTSNVNE